MGQIYSTASSLFSSWSKESFAVVHKETTAPVCTPDLASFTPSTYPLATPRRALCRTKRSGSPTPDLAREPQTKRLKRDSHYLNFPFLNDDFTIDFVKKSKVMFIMKGLQGSGKTFISQVIQELYKDTCVCSADQYFMQDGVYEFDRGKLKEAHEYCQQQAASAAEQSTHVIVIDNTNLQHWEMKFYLNLARTHLYIPVVVEPQTTWAMHPAELAVRNIHDIPEEILSNKIKAYQPVLPIYCGWFLNEVDSEKICSFGCSWLQKAIGIQDFVGHFSQALQADSNEDLFNLFAQDLVTGRRRLLHATSKFTARGKTIGANEYINSPVVKQSLGKGFKLCIVGFVITTRTIGARLKLSNEQLELWSSDDNEDPPVTPMNSGILKKHQFSHSDLDKSKEKLKCSKLNASVCLPTVVEKKIFCDEDRFCPTSGKGSRAHLTLACAPGIKPVTTGFDLILAVKCEQRMRGGENQKAETYAIDGGVLINYGEGIWVVYPNSELLVSSLFSTFL